MRCNSGKWMLVVIGDGVNSEISLKNLVPVGDGWTEPPMWC